MKFVDVDPREIEAARQSHRGRVAYPLLKSFLETGKMVVRLDRTGMQQSLSSLQQTLRSYIRSHGMPIKIFLHQGEIHLARLDIDEDGNKIENWSAGPMSTEEPREIDPTEVARRFEEEKNKVTK